MTTSSEYALGIDLGTTYSCMAVMRNGQLEVLENDQGNRTTPSVVSFQDNTIGVGETAKNQHVLNTESTIYDVKRVIGRKFDDHVVSTVNKHVSFTMIGDEEGRTKIQVNHCGIDCRFSPEQISAQILTKLKHCAEQKLGTKISNAVITVPAYFDNEQRQATTDAGVIAGLNVLRIINEPTAAALAYGHIRKDQFKSDAKHVLVFDLGGGTFDVSLLEIDHETFYVKAVSGDPHLGGEDFDNKIVDHCIQDFKKKHSIDLSKNARAIARLKKECNSAKHSLSSSTIFSSSIDIPNLTAEHDYKFILSRSQFENLCQSEFQRCKGPIDDVLKASELKPSDVDIILMVGGSTRMLAIKKFVSEYFGKEPVCDINADEAVAMGAALQASLLNSSNDKSSLEINENSYFVIDVIPISLGIKVAGGGLAVIVPRNTAFPCVRSETFSNPTDNARSIVIEIYQGEHKMAHHNRKIGRFEFQGITPMPRGKTKIRVTFSMEENGLLQVTAQDITPSSHDKPDMKCVTVITENVGLKPAEIKQMKEELQRQNLKRKRQADEANNDQTEDSKNELTDEFKNDHTDDLKNPRATDSAKETGIEEGGESSSKRVRTEAVIRN